MKTKNPILKKYSRVVFLVIIIAIISGIGVQLLKPSKAAGSADLNGDGIVNIFDLSILLSNWNTTNTASDLNGDGIVNIFDLSTLLSNWNTTPTPLPPVVTITASPTSINSGSSANITWSATNTPTTCTASGAWSGSKATSGTQSTGAMNTAGTFTYTMNCSNSGGTGTGSAVLTVTGTAPIYCGGLTPCYGPATLAQHATTSNCWAYQTSGTTSVLYNLTNFAPNHSGGSGTILTTSTCGRAIDWAGSPSNSKHTSAKSNTQTTLNGYKAGYYDAAKP